MPDALRGYFDPNRHFTLDEYERYMAMPEWQRDNPPDPDNDIPGFESQEEALSYWPQFGEAKLKESREATRATKAEWALAIRRYNQFDTRNQRSPTQMDAAESQVPFTWLGVDKRVAMLCNGMPIPTATASTVNPDEKEEEKKQAALGGMNNAAMWELTANKFILSLYDVLTDAHLCGVGIWKLAVDRSQTGPFGRQGPRILIEQFDPRGFHPDPLAKRCDWALMRYFITTEARDLSEVRAKYPLTSRWLQAEAGYGINGGKLDKDGNYDKAGKLMQSPANEGVPVASLGDRDRVIVKEMWFKDEALEFICEYDKVVNTDEEGNVIDDGEPSTSSRPRVIDGYVVGRWQKRFPNGRCIIWANGVLLFNVRNPFPAGVPPFIFLPYERRGVVTPGIASRLVVMDKKCNNLLIRMSRTADANIERPTVMDQGMFDAPKRWSNVPLIADAILQARGATTPAYKVPPCEIPAFILPLYMEFKMIKDDLLGMPQILMGNVTEGSQLSSGTVGGLQESAAAPLRMDVTMVNEAIKELGRQLFALIRAEYPSEDLNYVDYDPITHKKRNITWNKRDLRGDEYDVESDVGSMLPGAQEGAYKQMLSLKRENCADAQAVLEAGRVPGWRRMLGRMRDDKLEQLTVLSTGKELGVAVKEVLKTKDNGAGRKVLD